MDTQNALHILFIIYYVNCFKRKFNLVEISDAYFRVHSRIDSTFKEATIDFIIAKQGG